ncbi:MAG TPA: sigma-54-dependent Fis family transcriptional regulator [Aliiroseovarius sp.]|nr:sigma-54-dependent Fis family transcriptional regulator [Aliiroseovarius sp.]
MLLIAPEAQQDGELAKKEVGEIVDLLGLSLVTVETHEQARAAWKSADFDILLVPVVLKDQPLQSFIETCLSDNPDLQTIVVVNRDQINEAAEALRVGVLDCLFRPFSKDRLQKTVYSALKRLGYEGAIPAPIASPDHSTDEPAQTRLSRPVSSPARVERSDKVIGSHQATQALRDAIDSVAQSTAPVLLRGEPGSGLSHCAHAIHEKSSNASAPFFTIECSEVTPATLPPDFLTREGPATYYFDEICDLSEEMQTYLVDLFTQSMPDRFHMIVSTCHDPEAAMRSGRLQRELFYQLCMTQVPVPPLRERGRDVVEIASQKLEHFSTQNGTALSGLSPEAVRCLIAYSWPGNLRQLVDVIRSIVVQYGQSDALLIEADMLYPLIYPDGSSVEETPAIPTDGDDLARIFQGQSLDQIERRVVAAIVAAEGGSVTRAAKVLKVAPSTLYRKRAAWETNDKS